MRKKPFTLKQRAICDRREGTKEATFLLDSFTWLYTPEGFKFWNFLNHKYLSAYYPGLSDVTKK